MPRESFHEAPQGLLPTVPQPSSISSPDPLTLLAAEERGRRYIESVLAGPDAPSADDDIGEDLDEELSDPEDDIGVDSPDDLPEAITQSRQPSSSLPHPDVDMGDPIPPPAATNNPENNPDPFYVLPSLSSPSYRRAADAPIFLLYLLVSWLHTHFHLPFTACNTILVVVLNILRAAGYALTTTPSPYVTLPSVISHLGVEPVFQVLPVCENCLEVFPSSTKPGTLCDHCSNPLFKSILRHNRRTPNDNESHRPSLQFPMKSIEAQLRDICAIPGMLGVLEEWRTKSRSPGRYGDNFDGAVCQELPGVDKRPFFENPRPQDSPPELRIGLTLGVDW